MHQNTGFVKRDLNMFYLNFIDFQVDNNFQIIHQNTCKPTACEVPKSSQNDPSLCEIKKSTPNKIHKK